MANSVATARDVRRLNCRTVLQYIYQYQPISRLEIGHLSGLSSGTMTSVVGELLAAGLIREMGLGATEGGRPRILLEMNANYGYFLGCELSDENWLVVELFDIMLTNIATFRQSLPEGNRPEDICRCIRAGVDHVLATAQVTEAQVLGMGVGVPGTVEHGRGLHVTSSIWQWVPVPFKELLQPFFAFPISLENGSKTMTLAEFYRQEKPAFANVIVVNIGTGVGAGIITEGRLYTGATNSAGDWGHNVIVLGGRVCRCGRRGCIEAYVGAHAILQTLAETDPASPYLAYHERREALTALVAGANMGDAHAQQTLAITATYLGAGLAHLINLFNPQRIIIGGMAGSIIGPAILLVLPPILEEHALTLPLEAVTISLGRLGGDAVSAGAARLPLEDFLASAGHMGSQTNGTQVLAQMRL